MDPLKDHTIEFTGLKDGEHDIQFVLEQPFFDASGEEEWQGGHVTMDVKLEKSSSLLVVDMTAKGTVKVHCDRCDGPLDQPVEGTGAIDRVVTLAGNVVPGGRRYLEGHPQVAQPLLESRGQEVYDLLDLPHGEGFEEDNVVHPVEEFGPEGGSHLPKDALLDDLGDLA